MSKRRLTPADEPFLLVRTLGSQYPDGCGIAPHAHSWGQLIYAASGVLSVSTEQGSWIAPPHWAVWAPAGVAHSMRFSGAASLRTIYLKPGLRGQPRESTVVTVSPLLRELIQRAVDIGMLDRRKPAHVAMTNLILHELRTNPTPSLDLPKPRSELLRRVAEHLDATHGERTAHASISRRFGVGVRTLERGFAAETGLSLGRWLRQARFLNALRRLGMGAPVKQVALDAGYRSPSAFVAAFRATFKTTPGRYFATARHDGDRPRDVGSRERGG